MAQDAKVAPPATTPLKPTTAPIVPGADADHRPTQFGALLLGSMGVVYGDIGTSPLYALKSALASLKDKTNFDADVVGMTSLLIWALIFIVTVKYVLFLMRADNKGEGGILSLMALAQKALGRRTLLVFLLGVSGASLFSGDAIITPAISVLSAVEGLIQVSESFKSWVLPISVVILISLFWFQNSGTAKVALLFGPVMAVFFAVIGLLGVLHIADDTRILYAINPVVGVSFLFGHGVQGFETLGLIFLAVTGAEALYADMGHFGRKPIQLAWVMFVLPALLLNYLGQGALVLHDPKMADNPFFRMAPAWALIPLVLLATAATVIASQAVITGAFSLVRQSIALGLLPRMEIQHTSAAQEGQIYIPKVNTFILVGVLILVFFFRTSDALANAYGIAVSGTMVVTTALAFIVVRKLWHWPLWIAAPFLGCMFVIDVAFMAANLAKLFEGGWVPLLLASASMLVMWSWVRGTAILAHKTRRDSIPTVDLIRMLAKSKPTRVPGTAIFLTSDPERAPSALMHNLKHNKVLHERIVLMSIRTETTPRVPQAKRYEIEKIGDDFTAIKLHYGYMETPRIPAALAMLRKAGMKFDIMTTSFFLGRRTLKASANSGMPLWQDKLFIALSKQAATAPDFFAIPSDRVVELGAQVTV